MLFREEGTPGDGMKLVPVKPSSFRFHLLRLLWHWSFPFVIGAVLGAVGSSVQVIQFAHLLDDVLANTILTCAQVIR